MCRNLRPLVFLLACFISVISAASEAPKAAKTGTIAPAPGGARAVLWEDPVDLESRNLFYGSGGEGNQPRGPFTFVEEDTEGTNPKFDVRDADGTKWKVKLGAEAPPEVAASRLLWAAGFFTHEDYFLADLQVQGLPRHLHRGQSLVGPDGTIHNVRFKRSMKGDEKLGIWQWGSNPFVGTREFNGLRVMMALMNNWDLKDENNAVYLRKHDDESADPKQIYLISDLGASFGTSGITLSVEGSRGNLEAYKRSKFIGSRTPDTVDFEAPGRPTLVETFNLPVFLHRIDLRWIGKRVPRADAKWMGELLSRLSPDQIRDAFRAAGYSAQDANQFASIVQARIAELNAL
jgi:hypothetical protein